MDLSCKIDGISLKNPLMPASGPLVGDEKKMKVLAHMGVGCMVTKTISTKAAQVPRPCIYGGKNYIMNCELWSEYSPEKWLNEILPSLKSSSDIPTIISCGYTKEDLEILIPKLDKYADAFEISTHYVGKDLNKIAETVKTIRKNTKKPFYMKLSPHMPDPVAFAKMVKKNGGNGIVATNSLGPTMIIDIEKRRIKVGNDKGQVWSSGPMIKPISLAIVKMIKEEVKDLTVIGVGGIKSAEDVVEYLLAGADAVQMLSGAMIYGKDLYEKIIKELPEVLRKYGFESIQDVIDTNLKQCEVKYVPKNPVINKDKCIKCKLCEKVCPYFAIELDEWPKVDINKCFGCGLCQSRCPKNAISGVI